MEKDDECFDKIKCKYCAWVYNCKEYWENFAKLPYNEVKGVIKWIILQ